jgi:ketosteroid isomerase-like protein
MSEPSPRAVFARLREYLLAPDPGDLADLWAEDVVVETPFSPGGPQRIRGRAELLALARAGRAALPVRFEEVRDVVVHETADPEVIVVEYEIAGTVTATNRPAAAGFIGVLRVRNGQVVHWREYQNVLAMAVALGRLPELLAAAGAADPSTG